MDGISEKSFQDLSVWQRAHQFVLAVYNYSDYFPQKEVYSLTAQLRRAAVSIPASIAAGFKDQSGDAPARLMKLAQGSLEECRYYLILARDLGYGDSQPLMPQLEEVNRLLETYGAAPLDSDV